MMFHIIFLFLSSILVVLHKRFVKGSCLSSGGLSSLWRGLALLCDDRRRSMANHIESIEDAQNDDERSDHEQINRGNDEVNVGLILVDSDLVVVRNKHENSNEDVVNALADPGGVEPEEAAEDAGHEDLDSHDVNADDTKKVKKK